LFVKFAGVAVEQLTAQAMVGGQKLKPSELELFDRESALPSVIPAEAGNQDFLDLAT